MTQISCQIEYFQHLEQIEKRYIHIVKLRRKQYRTASSASTKWFFLQTFSEPTRPTCHYAYPIIFLKKAHNAPHQAPETCWKALFSFAGNTIIPAALERSTFGSSLDTIHCKITFFAK